MASKRKSLSIEEKRKIIEEVDKNPHLKRVDLAKKLLMPVTTLNSIVMKREAILSEAATMGVLSKCRKHSKKSPFEELESHLFTWFQQARASNLPINGVILKEKAHEVATRLGIDDFTGSSGWLNRFKVRHGLVFKSACGESSSVSEETVKSWKSDLGKLIEGYEPRNIFNADETGLFYSLLPNKTLAFKGEQCHGGKLSKERLTVLFCCNSDGSEKLQPVVIGRFAKPQCFKHVQSLPCKYLNNKKAWITRTLFQDFLKSLDAKMGSANRKIILFVDRCAAHSPNTHFLRNVRVEFFPANCTSVLQPLDLGVIRVFKQLYRTALVRKAIVSINCRQRQAKINLLQAIHFVASAWESVNGTTIKNCFAKGGSLKH